MDIVLGVSMTPTTVRMVLVEGEKADGVTVDHDTFDVGSAEGSANAAEHVVSAVLGVTMGAGRRGPSSRIGVLYGISFGLGALTLMLFDMGLVRAGLDDAQASLLFPGTFTLLIGALYLAGSTAARRGIDVAQYVTGVLLLLAVVIATFVGAPHHLLVYAAAGLAFFAGAWTLLRRER